MADAIGSALGALADGLVEGLEAARKNALKQAADARIAEAKALREEKARLESLLGPNHPSVLELDQAAAQAEALALLHRQTLKRADAQPQAKPDEWLVAGKVTGPDGAPVKGTIVTLTDKENKFTALLKTATANDNGEFFRLFSAREQPDLFRVQPEVSARVVDARGQPLSPPSDFLKVEAGATALFDIRLLK
ncbi:MAG: carboxypeptidase regulatory-like domain-containing protein [Acidobacteria bacterium]|nr:carboxypeptidase regulatory-like domain-containing protein [Acidobacteriota bacterium]